MKCPICGFEKPEGESFCSQCNFTSETYLSEVGEKRKAEYAERVRIARENWEELRKLRKKTEETPISPENEGNIQPFRANQSSPHGEKTIPRPLTCRFDLSTPIPHLHRDQFETKSEFQDRINQHPPVKIGVGILVDQGYKLKTKQFPIKIHFDSWVIGVHGIREGIGPIMKLDEMPFIVVGPKKAKRIYSKGEKHPVFASLSTKGKKIFAHNFYLLTTDGNFPIHYMAGLKKYDFEMSIKMGFNGAILAGLILVFCGFHNPIYWFLGCGVGAFIVSLADAISEEIPENSLYAMVALSTIVGAIAGPIAIAIFSAVGFMVFFLVIVVFLGIIFSMIQ